MFEMGMCFMFDLCGVEWLKYYINFFVVFDLSYVMGYVYGVVGFMCVCVVLGVDGLLIEVYLNFKVVKLDVLQ